MAEILQFRGVLYDPTKVGDVTTVVAPPYDVIRPAEQAALYERHPCNVVRHIRYKLGPLRSKSRQNAQSRKRFESSREIAA